eukprot:CAMPEP_0113935610 /NCGR_PEP_ID=MMETSP1339-20121228/2736_1 /TAXON_ID=94617 /ORGANISM="Fibrocapsa japonica" /LENGTH=336 /DNA_ID=CAMNT_0000937829 /DNA_START=191 /DNA_END=1201 /DNA_ORIENTATION=+ /assembly_acc=CAM_ASM_000762
MVSSFFDNIFKGESSATTPISTTKSFKVAVSGSSGMIGQALIKNLEGSNINGKPIQVLRITRKPGSAEDEVKWNPSKGTIDGEDLEGVDAVVHLAGENVASGDGGISGLLGTWTNAKKDRILTSRVQGTQLLADTIAGLKNPPKVFVCSSAVGYYGYQGGAQEFTEQSEVGDGFLAQVCQEWEDSTKAASKKCRVVNLRTGIVLAAQGGVLAKLMPLFQVGGGGNLGSGSQYMSWISIRDMVNGIKFAIEKPSLSGPVNVVAPRPVTNAEFTQALASAVSRPAIVPLPEPVGRVIFGQMGEEMLFGGQRVSASKLQKAGFNFEDENINSALQNILV